MKDKEEEVRRHRDTNLLSIEETRYLRQGLLGLGSVPSPAEPRAGA